MDSIEETIWPPLQVPLWSGTILTSFFDIRFLILEWEALSRPQFGTEIL